MQQNIKAAVLTKQMCKYEGECRLFPPLSKRSQAGEKCARFVASDKQSMVQEKSELRTSVANNEWEPVSTND